VNASPTFLAAICTPRIAFIALSSHRQQTLQKIASLNNSTLDKKQNNFFYSFVQEMCGWGED